MAVNTNGLDTQINTAVSFTLAHVTVPNYIELDDLRQEVALVIIAHAGLEQDRLNRLAEDRITSWIKQEEVEHAITVASAEAMADHLGYEVDPAQMMNLSHRGVEALLSQLSSQQQRVICMRFGVGMPRTYTIPEVATILQISNVDVSECERCAMARLRQMAGTSGGLINFLIGFM